MTILWVVGITNAFNLLDNMDGLSAGIAVIAALAIFGVALLQHRYLVSALALALAGCAAGFLRANFHPAKIYMGDAGSLFLGFILAVLLLKLARKRPDSRAGGRHTRDPGRRHLRHHSCDRVPPNPSVSPFQGWPRPHEPPPREARYVCAWAVTTIYAAGVVLGGAALLMSQLGPRAHRRRCRDWSSSQGSRPCPWPGCPFTCLVGATEVPEPEPPENPAAQNGAVGGSLSAGGKEPIALS